VRLKGWGIVYDPQNNQPVKRAIARLFNLQLNKLVSTQVTDNQGRYYFLAGNGKYSITVEHDGYYTAHTPVIDLEGEDADVIEEKIALQHKNDSLNLELNIPSTTALATKENTPGIGDNNFIKPPENIIENTPPNSDNSVPKPPEKEDKLG
jgi:hypothetical protein